MSNQALLNGHEHPNDEFYTSAKEVDYVMSRVTQVLPEKTLYIFGADKEWSEWVKWAKSHHLKHVIYDVDMFYTPGIVLLQQENYDKIIFITNPPFSVLKYFLPVLELVLKELPTKFCYFLLLPLTVVTSRYCRGLWTMKHNKMHLYIYPERQLMLNGTNNKECAMSNVVFTTNLAMDDLFPVNQPKLKYLEGNPSSVLLPSYALRFERYFNQQHYYLVDWEVRISHNKFSKQLWVRHDNQDVENNLVENLEVNDEDI